MASRVTPGAVARQAGEELGPGERTKGGLRTQRWDCGGAHALGRADMAQKAARGAMSRVL